MSLSLCFIGNSHIAAIKQAWTNRAPALQPDVSADFFSAGTNLLRSLELDGTVLRCGSEDLREKIAYTSGGLESIDLLKYDVFVMVGSGFSLDIPRFLEGWDLASPPREPGETLISRACAEAVIEAILEDTDAIALIDTIKSVSDKPVLLCAAPCLSERVLTDEEDFRTQPRYQDFDFLRAVVAAGKAAGEKIAKRHRFSTLWQEEDTIGVPGFTKAEYGLNPIRFTMKTGRMPPIDRRHGNEDYGFIMLTAMLKRIDALTGGRTLPAHAKEPALQS